jgi:hypothetical protein
LSSNDRGAQVDGIPDEVVPAIMRRLESAAREAGKMPVQHATRTEAYPMPNIALAQLPP